MLLITELHVVQRTGGDAGGLGVVEIHAVGKLLIGDVRVDLILIDRVQQLIGVGQHEAVQVHHDGQHHIGILSDLVGLENRVIRLLLVFGVQLDPAALQLSQGVTLVAVDVPGRRDGTVCVHHDDGEAGAARVVQALNHVQQALAGRRREGTRTDRARAQAGAHRAVLGLNVHVLAVQGAILHEIAQPLDHDGLRGDGVSGDHMGLRLTHGQRDCLVAGNKQLLAHTSVSFTMVIAPSLQARLQTPQPLQ